MTAYYNEYDPYAAQWLRNLIAAGHIAPGVVDERSIKDVKPDDLKGFTQCHFFAGIGVWSHALRLAGWPDDRPVWTGSCPCQSFSTAGKGAGVDDERHLWPDWFRLIEQCRPPVVFGEQVEAAIKHDWLDLVQSDLEGSGYAVGPVGLPAAGIGAPHIRQRLWFVGENALGDTNNERRNWQHALLRQEQKHYAETPGGGAACPDCGWETTPILAKFGCPRCEYARISSVTTTGPTNGHWRDADWLCCRDGRWRPVEPGTFPLVNGAAARVGRLRAYGNAIVPQVAAEVIAAYMECRP